MSETDLQRLVLRAICDPGSFLPRGEVARLQARVDSLTGQIHEGCPNVNDDLDCPWCRVAELTIERDQLRQQLEAESVVYYALRDERDHLADQVAGRDATIQRVRDRHSEFKIYTECGHENEDDCVNPVEVDEIGWTCDAGYLYSICRECCTHGGDGQTEECADYHSTAGHPITDGCWPCDTRKDIDDDPADDGSQTNG